jgi:large subunit ribosomal protein L21
MYAIVKTGGKQYKVAPGDILAVERLDVPEGKSVALEVLCVVDGAKVEADPEKAAKTKVEAVVLEQFKGEKQLVFKFKKRKNYKKLRGHRQDLTRIQIASVGSVKAEVKGTAQASEKKEAAEKPVEKKAAAAEPKASKTEKASKADKAENAEKAETKAVAQSTDDAAAIDEAAVAADAKPAKLPKAVEPEAEKPEKKPAAKKAASTPAAKPAAEGKPATKAAAKPAAEKKPAAPKAAKTEDASAKDASEE